MTATTDAPAQLPCPVCRRTDGLHDTDVHTALWLLPASVAGRVARLLLEAAQDDDYAPGELTELWGK